MLHELHIEYKDGRTEHKIIHTKPGEQAILYPQRDNIQSAYHKPFKYKVPKHPTKAIGVVHYAALNKWVIIPYGIECVPHTRYKDLDIIGEKPVTEPKPIEKPKTWKFESSSGGGFYEVRMTPNGLKCNCFGAIRSKQNCKHIKEVREGLK